MKGYSFIFCVDLEKRSHNKKIVKNVINLLEKAKDIAVGYTYLSKENNIEFITEEFRYKIPLYLNDPLGLLYDNEYEEYYNDEDEQERMENIFSSVYTDEFISMHVQFVSSKKLFNKFCELNEDFDVYNCGEFYTISYEISLHDQMEILEYLQKEKINDKKRSEKSDHNKKIILLENFLNIHKN